MPRASKRKAAPPASVTSDVDSGRSVKKRTPRTLKSKAAAALSVTSSDVNCVLSASGKVITKELQKIDILFESYKNQSSGMIEPEGIEALCNDMEVEYTDVRMLILAWKTKAEKQGFFSLDEWRRGLKDLRADTLNKMKKALSVLEKEVKTSPNFEDLYCFAFRYSLTEENRKSVDVETICELLNLVLRPRFHSQVDLIIEYLKIQKDYRVLNMDQWTNIFRFCSEIIFPDMQNYDSDQAWPVILDNFVEWVRENKGSGKYLAPDLN